MSSRGKTTADVCAECGHTRYVHPPNAGCDVASHYYVDTCTCSGFKDADPTGVVVGLPAEEERKQ